MLPPIQTERLLIRDFTEDDFDAVYAYSSDPEGVRYMAFPPSTPEETHTYIGHCMRLALEEPRICYFMAVVRKATNQVIGGVRLGVMDWERGEGSFSYLFSRSAWGQGYATEALRAMVRFGFEQLALNRLADGCDVENIASARVMEKCGFRCEDERDGERFYALTRAEWQEMMQHETV
ncbi:MAG: GNAT family N-acetyltransferase [Caldilineaceae bacterium]